MVWQLKRLTSYIVMLIVVVGVCGSGAFAYTVTDIAGRTVSLPDIPPQRIILGEGRLITAIALLERADPFGRIVGWQGDFKRSDPQNYQIYQEVYPEIEQVSLIGVNTPQSVSVERVLSLNPDLAILSISGHGPGLESELVRQLTAAQIPVIFVDFRTAPLKNTIPSMELLGRVLDRTTEATQYIDFYQAQLRRVTDIIRTIPVQRHPKVFIELKAGTWNECCHTAGKGNMGDFIDLAGGENIAKSLLPGALGQINLEAMLVAQPDIYIASGNLNPGTLKSGLVLGATTSLSTARQSAKTVLSEPILQQLAAVKQGRAYGIWHGYYNSPYNIVAIQVMAKWFYPELFKDLNPDETLATLYSQFLTFPLTGTYWIEL